MTIDTNEGAGGLIIELVTSDFDPNVNLSADLRLGSAGGDNVLSLYADGGHTIFGQSAGRVGTPRLHLAGVGDDDWSRYDILGGTLSTGAIVAGSQCYMYWDGGTIQAAGDSTDWISTNLEVRPYAGTATTLDTQGYNVTVNGDLVARRDWAGTSEIIKTGSGRLLLPFAVISSEVNDYEGTMSVSEGELQVGNNQSSSSLPQCDFAVAGGATLTFSRNANDADFGVSDPDISGGGDVVFRGQQDGYFTFRGDYTGTLSYTGRTIVDLDDAPGNTGYQGALWLEKDDMLPHAGVLELRSGKVHTREQHTTGLTVAGIEGNAGTYITTDRGDDQKWTIDVPDGEVYTYAGVIGDDGEDWGSDNEQVTKTGPGTQVFTGANTYDGGTTVTGGMLLANNTTGSGTGSGPVTVNGGTLGGTGIIAPDGSSPITIDAGGKLAPGDSIESLEFDLSSTAGGVTLAGGAGMDFELGAAGVTIAAPGDSDQILIGSAAAGDVTFNGNVIDFLNTGEEGWYKLFATDLTTGSTWGGLTLTGQQITAGLSIANLGETLIGSLLLGDGETGDFDDIYLQVDRIPEPASLALIGLCGCAIFLRRRLSRFCSHGV